MFTRAASPLLRLLFRVGLSLLLSIVALPALAAEWTSLGPPGGTVTAFAQASSPSEAIYAGVRDGGVFRSNDDGLTWQPARGRMVAGEVHTLVADPGMPSTLLAGTDRGVYRTINGGATWTLHTDGLPRVSGSGQTAPVRALAIDPANPQRVYAGAGAGVWKSVDGGRTWSDAGEDPAGSVVLVLSVDPSAPDVLFTGTNRGLFRSEDGAATWQSLAGRGGPDLFLDNVITDLALDLAAPGTAYVALLGPGPSLAKTTDGGTTWAPIVSGLPFEGESPAGGWTIALDPGLPGVLYAAGDVGIFRSDQGGTSWMLVAQSLNAFGHGNLAFASLVSRSGAVLVGTGDLFQDELGDGVFRSPDGLTEWETVRSGMTAVAVDELLPHPRANGVLYALRFDGKVLRSDDHGAVWSLADQGIEDVEVVDVAVDPSEPDVLYAVAAGGSEGFFRSIDQGRSWQPAGAGLPCCRLWVEAIPPMTVPEQATVLVVAPGGSIYRSLDRGTTFESVSDLPIGDGSLDLRDLESVSPSTLYLLGLITVGFPCPISVCPPTPLLFRSTDSGATWDEVEVPDIGALAVDPVNPARLSLLARTTLFRSFDRGESWQEISQLPASQGSFHQPDLLADPERPGVLYASTFAEGVLRSVDDGVTWRKLGSGLASPAVGALSLSSAAGPDTLYAASSGGAWSLRLAGAAPPPAPPAGPTFTSSALPGFRVWVRITASDGSTPPVRREPSCIPETLCISGAIPGRSEVFVRIVGPKGNGRLWPTLVKFTTSRVEVWIEQMRTGELGYYLLPGANPGVDALPGLFDRQGFEP